MKKCEKSKKKRLEIRFALFRFEAKIKRKKVKKANKKRKMRKKRTKVKKSEKSEKIDLNFASLRSKNY